MKKLLSTRWFWFVSGILFFPALGIFHSLLFGPSPRDAMPFKSRIEEKRTEVFFLGDFTYYLKSEVNDISEFHKFAKKMKMEEFKISDTLYETVSEDGQYRRSISYEDGSIIYEASQT